MRRDPKFFYFKTGVVMKYPIAKFKKLTAKLFKVTHAYSYETN